MKATDGMKSLSDRVRAESPRAGFFVERRSKGSSSAPGYVDLLKFVCAPLHGPFLSVHRVEYLTRSASSSLDTKRLEKYKEPSRIRGSEIQIGSL